MQQSLPFTVLKLKKEVEKANGDFVRVATVLTVHGIETEVKDKCIETDVFVATVLTVHGIETIMKKTHVREQQ